MGPVNYFRVLHVYTEAFVAKLDIIWLLQSQTSLYHFTNMMVTNCFHPIACSLSALSQSSTGNMQHRGHNLKSA